MTKLMQICASENDLFGLDADGVVYHGNFNADGWMRLGRGHRDDGVSRLVGGRIVPAAPEVSDPPCRRVGGVETHMGQDELEKPSRACARIDAHGPPRRTLTAATLLVLGVHLAFGVLHADVATSADMAACNQEARDGRGTRTASPTQKDEAGADRARQALAGTGEGSELTGDVLKSPDPQIHGMNAEGAKDAAYRAVYRVCMRKKGF